MTTSYYWWKLGTALPVDATATVNGESLTPLQCFERALKEDPTNSLAWTEVGALLIPTPRRQVEGRGLREYDAVQCLNEALRLNPTYPLAWTNMGLSVLSTGCHYSLPATSPTEKHQEYTADQCFLEALKLTRRSSFVWLNMGLNLMARRTTAVLPDSTRFTAVQCFTEAVKLDRRCRLGWFLLGILGGPSAKGAKCYATTDCFRLARERQDPSPQCWVELGTALTALKATACIDGKILSSGDCYEKGISSGTVAEWVELAKVQLRSPAAYHSVSRGHLSSIQCCLEALKLDSLDAPAWIQLCIGLLQESRDGCDLSPAAEVLGPDCDPRRCLAKGLELDPTSTAALLVLSILKHRGEPVSSIFGKELSSFELSQLALCYDATSARAWDFTGNFLFLTQKNRCATVNGQSFTPIHCLKQSLRYDPTSAESWKNLAVVVRDTVADNVRIAVNGKEFSEADCLVETLTLNPDCCDYWTLLGNTLGRLRATAIVAGVEMMASECYKTALQIDPKHVVAWSNLTGQNIWERDETILINGESVTRIQCSVKALEFNPNLPEVWNNLGFCLAKQNTEAVVGDTSYTAQRCYEKCLALSPSQPSVWSRLAYIMKAPASNASAIINNKSYSALECLKQVIVHGAPTAEVWHDLGMQLLSSGRKSLDVLGEAVTPGRCFIEALERNSKLPYAWMNLGIAAASEKKTFDVKGQPCDALRCYLKAIELHPKIAALWLTLAVLLMQSSTVEHGHCPQGHFLCCRTAQSRIHRSVLACNICGSIIHIKEAREKVLEMDLGLYNENAKQIIHQYARNIDFEFPDNTVCFCCEMCNYDVCARCRGCDRMTTSSTQVRLRLTLPMPNGESSSENIALSGTLFLESADSVAIGGKLYTALDCLIEAVNVEPNFGEAWGLVGAIGEAKKLGKVLAAKAMHTPVDCMSNAIRLGHSTAETWCNLGTALRKEGPLATIVMFERPLNAIDCFVKALEQNVLCLPAWEKLATGLMYSGVPHVIVGGLPCSPVTCAERAFELEQQNPRMWSNLAGYIVETKQATVEVFGKSFSASQCFENAFKLDKCDANVWSYLGSLLRENNVAIPVESGAYTALQCFQKAVECNRERADLWSQLGSCLQSFDTRRSAWIDGQEYTASQCYIETLTRSEVFPWAWLNLGVLIPVGDAPPKRAEVNKQKYTAVDCFKNELKRDPTCVLAWLNLGNSMPSAGSGTVNKRTYTIVQCFQQAVTYAPTCAPGWARLGSLLSRGETIRINCADYDARGCLQEAMKVQDPFWITHLEMVPNTLVTIGSRLGESDSVLVNGEPYTARRCFMEALRRNPKYAPAWLKLGSVLQFGEEIEVFVGDKVTALRCFQEAVSSNPSGAMGWYCLGRCTIAFARHFGLEEAMVEVNGEHFTSAQCFQEALKHDPSLIRLDFFREGFNRDDDTHSETTLGDDSTSWETESNGRTFFDMIDELQDEVTAALVTERVLPIPTRA